MIATSARQIAEVSGSIHHQELAASGPLDRLRSDYWLIVKDGCGVRVLERPYRHYADDLT